MSYRIQYRRATAAVATANNVVLAAGEPGLETDTGKVKVGDGITAWNSLAYEPSAGSVATAKGEAIAAAAADATTKAGDAQAAGEAAAAAVTVASLGAITPDGVDTKISDERVSERANQNYTFGTRRGDLPSVVPVPATLPDVVLTVGLRPAIWMSADRTTLHAGTSLTMRHSVDDAVTWVDGHAFATNRAVHGIRDLDNGELLVSLQVADNTGPGEVWLSSGYTTATPLTATWTKVLTCSGGSQGNFIQGQWGMSVYRNIALVSEYGGVKTAPNNARYVYLSTDYGKTFVQIFDLGAITGHVHGVAYDPYDERIWVNTGDGVGAQSIQYSDDMGATWRVLSVAYQAVGVIVLPNCVLFTSDRMPNGVYRVPRTRNKRSIPVVEVAYLLDNQVLDPAYVGSQPFQARYDGAPALLGWAWGNAGTGSGILLATVDGYNFTEIWRDTIEYATAHGVQRIVGPTASGKLIGSVNDGRDVGGSYSCLTATAPAWPGLVP